MISFGFNLTALTMALAEARCKPRRRTTDECLEASGSILFVNDPEDRPRQQRGLVQSTKHFTYDDGDDEEDVAPLVPASPFEIYDALARFVLGSA